MTETVKLPIDLNDCEDPAHINERLKTGVAELDWSRVRDTPAAVLIPLLSGLDLSRDADALGLEPLLVPPSQHQIRDELERLIVADPEALTRSGLWTCDEKVDHGAACPAFAFSLA